MSLPPHMQFLRRSSRSRHMVPCSKPRIKNIKITYRLLWTFLVWPPNSPQHPDREFREYLLLGLIQGFNPGVECALSQNHICNNLQSALAEPRYRKRSHSERSQIRLHDRAFSTNPPFKIFRISPIGIAQENQRTSAKLTPTGGCRLSIPTILYLPSSPVRHSEHRISRRSPARASRPDNLAFSSPTLATLIRPTQRVYAPVGRRREPHS